MIKVITIPATVTAPASKIRILRRLAETALVARLGIFEQDEQSHHDGGVVLDLHGFPFGGGRLRDHEALGG